MTLEVLMIRVIIADDFETMRQVMRHVLEQAPDIRVVAEAWTFDGTLEACGKHDCNALVLDDYLPPYRCDTAIKRLREANITVPILVTSMHVDADMARRALDSGAAGFLLKTDLQDHFIPAVRALHAGKTYLSPRVAQLLGNSDI
jgi:DNA-binding NarL/FixJ family response regulator